MAVTHRDRRTAYDNIAAGSATGKERTVLGDGGVTELYGGGYGTGSTDSVGRNNITVGSTDLTPDQIGNGSAAAIVGGSTDQNTTDPTDERTGSSNVAGFVTNP